MTDYVAGEIAEYFSRQGLREGDSIPSTARLASDFAVSRTVIREALAQLSARGLLYRRQGREGILTRPQAAQLSELLESKFGHERVTQEDLHAFREIVEVGAARLAAEKADRAAVAQLSDLASSLGKQNDATKRLEIDVAFHRTIAYAANPVFGFVLDGLTSSLMASRLAVWEKYVSEGGSIELANLRHTALRDAIAAGNAELAAEAMVADLADTKRELYGR